MKKRKTSVPSDGYICALCKTSGHWIQQCPIKTKRKKKNPSHIHTPGVDPSQSDIDKARELQKIRPPNCYCDIKSRLKKVKKSKAGENSRAIGKYFFFCSKAKFDRSKCKFAKPVENALESKVKEKIHFTDTNIGEMNGKEVNGDNRETHNSTNNHGSSLDTKRTLPSESDGYKGSVKDLAGDDGSCRSANSSSSDSADSSSGSSSSESDRSVGDEQ